MIAMRDAVGLYGLVATIVVAAGVVLLILLFERRRARQIQRDLRDMAQGRHRRR